MGSWPPLERLAAWAVPRSAVELPAPSAAGEVLAWLQRLAIEVPPPAPIALRWLRGGCIEVPVADAIEDEDTVIWPDQADLGDVAHGVVGIVHDAERRYPGPLSWRRWRLTGRASSLLYTTGITRSGGSAGMDGRDAIGGWIYHLPRWRDVLPQRGGPLRPYVLGLPSWWWECQRRQGWQLRGRHRPCEPYVMGVCAACLPCPSCGALYACNAGCEMAG